MAVLNNVRKEKFAQCLIQGMSQRKAYLEAFPSSHKWKSETVDKRASELYNSREILGRCKELQEESKNAAIMTRQKRMIVLSKIAENENQRADSRIKAIDTLNKMDGEYVNNVKISGSVSTRPKVELNKEQMEQIMKGLEDG